jgi:hypothetical protein
MGLPEPMLAKSGALPSGRGWSFEPKWDGYRAIVRSGENYCVRSRRGWLMTELLPELAGIPIQGVFDGELVAFGDDGLPSFDRLSRRILHGDTRIAVGLVFFDVLEVEGLSTMHQSYRERRAILVLLDFGPGVRRRRSAVGVGMRARAGGGRGEAARRAVSTWGTDLDQAEELSLGALPGRTGSGDPKPL